MKGGRGRVRVKDCGSGCGVDVGGGYRIGCAVEAGVG